MLLRSIATALPPDGAAGAAGLGADAALPMALPMAPCCLPAGAGLEALGGSAAAGCCLGLSAACACCFLTHSFHAWTAATAALATSATLLFAILLTFLPASVCLSRSAVTSLLASCLSTSTARAASALSPSSAALTEPTAVDTSLASSAALMAILMIAIPGRHAASSSGLPAPHAVAVPTLARQPDRRRVRALLVMYDWMLGAVPRSSLRWVGLGVEG